MELHDDSASDDSSGADDADAMTKFLDGDRPTSAGEPSHNVPRKLEINPWCISTSVLLLSLCVFILITIFAPKLFETAIQNMLHFMMDKNKHNAGEGGFQIPNLFMIFFCIMNTSVLAMCGNIDYLLMVSCGYIYGDNEHEWLTGAAVYIVSNYIGCCLAFAIGRTLFKDKIYFLFSKYEKYRYFQRAFTDYSLLLSTALNLNPFLPSGLIVYCLSLSSMSWMYFLIGQASRIPNAAIMCYAGYFIRRYTYNEPIENTNIAMINTPDAYKSNPYTNSFTITFCVIFAVLLLFTVFAIYLQFERLVLGDILQKAQENPQTESTTSSTQSMSDSNEDIDGSYSDSSSSSSESGDTYDEYGALNSKKQTKEESFLFEKDYKPTIADHSETDQENGNAAAAGDLENAQPRTKSKHRKKSKHRLETDPQEKKKKKKKKKKRKMNNKIWQTIVLATSPTEPPDTSMLFEEGPSKKDGEQNYFGRQQQTPSIVIDANARSNSKVSVRGSKDKGDGNNGSKSPRSPKAAFDKFFNKKENNDAGSPRPGR
eukprot:550021_1